MSNSFATVDKVLNEALFVLENQLVLARNVDRQYSDEFARANEKVGGTIRVKKPPRFTYRSGATASAQDITENTINVGPIAQGGVDMSVASLDAVLKNETAWTDFAKNRIAPAMATIANKVDRDLCSLYDTVPNWVGTAGTTPATALVLLEAQQKLFEMGCPDDGNIFLAVDPAANAALVDGLKGLFHSGPAISDQFRKGRLADNVLGYREIGMDQNIRRHIGGTQVGTPLVAGGSQTGAELDIDGLTGSATVAKGDVFTIAGVYAVNPQSRESTGSLQQFVVTADATASSGAVTLSIFPSIVTSGAFQTVSAGPADNAAITFKTRASGTAAGGDPQNLAFHKSAFTLATVDLPLPGGVHFAARKVHNGISMRVISDYDATNDVNLLRFDIAYVAAPLYRELACRISG